MESQSLALWATMQFGFLYERLHFFYAAIHKKWKRNCKVSDLKGMKDLLKLRKETSSVNKLEGKWLDLERQQSQDRQICQSELYSAKWYLVWRE